MSTPPATDPTPRFHAARPRDLHAPPPPWHRLAFIVRTLPARLESLSRELHVPPDGRVLDFGSADAPYRSFFAADVDFITADLPGNPRADVEIDSEGTVPVEDESFDAVLSTQVLEHVADPERYLSECFRVLRPGGRLLLSTHGIMVYHPDPVDLWRWTCAGLEHSVGRAGFEIVRREGIMGLAGTGLQLVQEAVYYRLPLRLRPALALVVQTLIRVADRWERSESRDLNALVFAVVARRP